MEIVDTKGIC